MNPVTSHNDSSTIIPSLLIIMVKKFEGLRLKPYLCSAGVATIGYGHTGSDVTLLSEPITKEQAEILLINDLKKFYLAAKKLCPNANPLQLCALADFSYNLGIGRLKSSTLRRKFNAGYIEAAKREILRWNRGGGKVLAGLTKRRQAESALL